MAKVINNQAISTNQYYNRNKDTKVIEELLKSDKYPIKTSYYVENSVNNGDK